MPIKTAMVLPGAIGIASVMASSETGRYVLVGYETATLNNVAIYDRINGSLNVIATAVSVVLGRGGLSADGTVAAYGSSIWSQLGGTYTLPPLVGGLSCTVSALSSSGLYAAGSSTASGGFVSPVRWALPGGAAEYLGLVSGHPAGYAAGISGDGSVVVGTCYTGGPLHAAFRWQGGVMTDIASSLGVKADAFSVSSNGNKVLGEYLLSGSQRAFIWDIASGFTLPNTALRLVNGSRPGFSFTGSVALWLAISPSLTWYKWTSAAGEVSLNSKFTYAISTPPMSVSGDGLSFATTAIQGGDRYVMTYTEDGPFWGGLVKCEAS